jgi:hypothetical protein
MVVSAFAAAGEMSPSAACAWRLRVDACACRRPGAVGPLPVGTSSAYWLTAEDEGAGTPSCAPTAFAEAPAATTAATATTTRNDHGLPPDRLSALTRGTAR